MTLTQIEEPYLVIEEATTYQLSACYNVSIDCHSGDMTANIRTSTLFGGKVYAKGSPVSCMVDVDDAMEFSITMAYTDLACGVEREGLGGYTNDVIIQHHDSIVTSADLGLQLSCEYDLTNKSVSNNVDLTLTGEITPTLFEESVVDSPNVIMKIADKNGQDAITAVVGDPLTMVWEILDLESPYEISVRDLVAVDGATDTELQLIDANGCPTDSSIMGEVRKSELSEKILLSSFDAFRFPTSEVVQFRAMITPCLPKCKPVDCSVLDYTGQTRVIQSYGKRKKREISSENRNPLTNYRSRSKRDMGPEDVMVIQTLKIVDRYGKRKSERKIKDVREEYSFENNHRKEDQVSEDLLTSDCLNKTSMVTGAIVFLLAQIIIVILFAIIWRRNHNQKDKELMMGPESRTDSLSYMYETGLARRLQ